MAIRLLLKKRKTDDTVSIPLRQLKSIMGKVGDEAKDELWELLKPFGVNEVPGHIHDKGWLELIANWTPTKETPQGNMPSPLPLTEIARWFKLIDRVNDLDDNQEGYFTLSMAQADMIWERIKRPDFKLVRMSTQFIEFIAGFCEAASKSFEDVDTEDVADFEPLDSAKSKK